MPPRNPPLPNGTRIVYRAQEHLCEGTIVGIEKRGAQAKQTHYLVRMKTKCRYAVVSENAIQHKELPV